MPRPSLLSRLFLLLGVLGVGFLFLAFYLYRGTERLLTEELHGSLSGDLEWMAAQVAADPGLLRRPRADSLARDVARRKGYRVTVIAADGAVLGESHVPPDRLHQIDNHADRPEVAAALARGTGAARRISPTVRQEMYYVARSLGEGRAVLRVAAGPATLDGFADVALRTAVAALLLFLLAAAVIALWVSRRISQPLLRLRDEARDVSRPLWWDAPFREAEILNEAFAEYAGAVQKLAAEVRSERDRLLELLDRLEEGVVLLDRAGRVRAANASARRLLPLREGDGTLEGRPFRSTVRHEGLGRWAAEARLDAARESVFQVDKGPDSTADLLCHLRLLKSGRDEGETLLTLVDVTSFRNLDRAKTDFVANASHELKTPLSSILGYSETLLEGAMEDPHARGAFLRKIHANALRLQGLVQDLLNLTQLESQGARPRVETLFVRDFAQAAWNHHRSAAERSGLRLENRLPWDLTWSMEPRDLDLILGNLIGNAVKYNSPGGKVRVEWEADSRALSVRDDGPGIPAEALPRIFERFYRGGAARARNEGTGLGLAIVKHAAQRYGITVAAESAPGEGSRFTLEVPEEMVGMG
jgi:two-component system, OmpR family, phosphate regulon sensor histidine kinase PhoR